MRIGLALIALLAVSLGNANARTGPAIREIEAAIVRVGDEERVTVGQAMIALKDCVVQTRANGVTRSQRADVGKPCAFGMARPGKVRILQIGARFVLTVESSSRLADSADCRTRIQGIVVDGSVVSLARRPQIIAACAPARWDQTMLAAFSVRPVPMPRP
jgi:hypothetical protein